MKEKLLHLIKTDTILVVSGLLATVSCFFVHPDKAYVDYINYRVLAILFSLMLVVGAMRNIGTFNYLTKKLLSKIHSERIITLFLVILSFFLSMFLTNDVALVTLVPFALLTLKAFGDRRRTVYTLILMTVGANLGSMLTPIGNPQNLYLYTEYNFTLPDFIKLTLPYTAAALVLLIVSVFVLNRTDKTVDTASTTPVPRPSVPKFLICLALFVVCLLTVAGILHYLIMLGICAVIILVMDRRAFLKVDYALLLTFVFFFILIGNLGRIEAIKDALSSVVDQNVVLAAVLSSQVISNVPAAMLLSAFTTQGSALVVGVNLGGLGTLIASMASLITYKFYAKESRKGEHYILKFTLISVIFLVPLYLLTLLLL